MKWLPLGIFLSFGNVSAAQNLDGSEPLKIGYYERNPFQHRTEDNMVEGLDIDLISSIMDEAGLQYRFVSVPWKRILHMLSLGTLDIAMSAAILPERQKYAHFSNEVFRLGQNALFVRTDDFDKFSTINQLSDLKNIDFKLGVVRGIAYSYEYEALLKEEWFQSRLVTVDTKTRPIELLLRNRVDGYLDSDFGGRYRIIQDNKQNQVKRLIHLMKAEDSKGYLMFSKKTVNLDLVSKIDAVMAKLKANGQYEKIFSKYQLDVDIKSIQ